MDLTAYIDLYCERTEPGLWGEPLNAVTNLAFVVAAWLCWHHYGQKKADYKSPRFDRSGALLMGVFGLLGVGSGLFHSFATQWSMWADVIPIAIFIHGFLFFALQRFFGLTRVMSLAFVGVFLVVSGGLDLAMLEDVLNGSAGYLLPFAVLVAMGAVMVVRRHPFGDLMLIASAVFMVALTFRTVDQMWCEQVPVGTHFLWHTFNGLALYLVGKAYLKSFKS